MGTNKYSQEEVDTALLTIAGCAGNAKRASDLLAARGIKIPARTLRHWRGSTYADRYLELAREHGREIEEIAVVSMREAILRAAEVETLGLEKAIDQLEKGEARDPAATARNASVVKGINTTHLLTLTGRPSEIRQVDSVESILARLQQRHPRMFATDTTAEEVPSTVSYEQTMREIERRRHPDD